MTLRFIECLECPLFHFSRLSTMSGGLHFSGVEYGDVFNELDGGSVVDERPLQDLHLGSAINLDEIEECLYPGKTPYRIMVSRYTKSDIDEIAKHWGVETYTSEVGFLEPSLDVCKCHDDVEHVSYPVAERILDILKEALTIRDIRIPISVFENNLSSGPILINRTWWTCFNTLLHGICLQSEISRGGSSLHYTDCKRVGRFAHFVLKTSTSDYECMVARNACAIRTADTYRVWVSTFENVLLLLDTLGQRICAQISSQVTARYQTLGSIAPATLHKMLDIGDTILRVWKNDGFEVIGMFEALVVATILRNSPDKIHDQDAFMVSCLDEISQMVDDLGNIEEGRDAIDELLKLLDQEPMHILSNLFCLYRIWGHPRVNIYEGMKKVHDLGTIEKEIPSVMPTIVLRQFRKMLLISYYRKHKVYPAVNFKGDTYINDQIRQGYPIDERHASYSIDDFDKVELSQIWKIPETYDICHTLNDKAVSPNKSELIESINHGDGTRCGIKRRGIYRWMTGQSIRCSEFLNKVDSEGIDDDAKIIGMYEKEREIKTKARMFSLMSEEMRTYFILTEELIANYVLPLFPEITMKDSLNVLLKKLWTAGGRRSKGAKHTNINIDFSKWNTNMRDALNQLLFSELDKLFGFDNLIARTHQIFTESYIYSASGKYVPEVVDDVLIPDPPMAYYGHLGGFEGLRQKGWTLTTVLILAYISDEMRIRAGLMGQGDNQVVRIYMPLYRWNNYELTEEQQVEEARIITREFLGKMDVYYTLARLPIKLRETWTSCRLFMYGKYMMLDGQALPQWNKKILRSYALSNEGALTISGVIGTIATNMAAAASVSEHPDVMYAIYLFLGCWSLSYLLEYHPFTRKSIIHSNEKSVLIPIRGRHREIKMTQINSSVLTAMLLTVPTSVGGSVCIPLTSFIIRGFPDQVSEGYSWVKLLCSVESEYLPYYRNWYTFLSNDTVEPDMLVQSPMSLNHKKPPTPGMQSRQDVRDWLLSGTFPENQFLRDMGPIMSSFARKEICCSLLTDPMNPLVTNEVYNTFPHVYLDGILCRIENTRTIKKLILKRTTRSPIITKMMGSEHNHMKYVWWRSCQTGETYSLCATEQARQARNIGWQREIVGVTTPHPIEVLHKDTCGLPGSECPPTDYIYVKTDQNGDFAPYLGSKVKTKVMSLQDAEARKEPLIKTGARIARYMQWINLGENMKELVLKNVGTVCDISIYDTFVDDDPSGGLYTGSVDHRFNPAAMSDGCFINYVPQIGQTVFMSSDNMPKYGRGQTNYTFLFQAMYGYIQYISAHFSYRAFKHYHVSCPTCIVPTNEEVPDIMPIGSCITNALSETVVDKIRETLGFLEVKPSIIINQVQEIVGPRVLMDRVSNKQIGRGVVWALAMQIANKITHYKENISDSVGVEDLQEYPRIYSYKIHRDLLLYRVAVCMIIIQSVTLNIVPHGRNMSRLKRRVQDSLLSTPLTTFKGIGSLSLGRTSSGRLPINELISESGSYPETVTSLLKSVKTSLVMVVNCIGRINAEPTGIFVIPEGMLHKREHLYMVCLRCFINDGCAELISRMHEDIKHEGSPDYKQCRHGCVSKQIMSCRFVKCSLDKMFKALSVKPPINNLVYSLPVLVAPQVLSIMTYSDGRDRTSYSNFIGPINDFEHVRDSMSIHLPTTSVYKWSHVISVIQSRDKVIVLGDGTGGTSMVISSKFKTSIIYPCALLETRSIVPQDSYALYPVLSRNLANVRYDILERVPDNITSKFWGPHLLEEVTTMGASDVLIVSDIEGVKSNIILGSLQENIPDGTAVCVKVYLRDFEDDHIGLRGWTEIQLIFTPYANLHYSEAFFYAIKSKTSCHVDIQSLWSQSNKGMRDCVLIYDEDMINRMIKQIDIAYRPAIDLSINLAISHLLSLSVMVTREQLRLSPDELYGYITQYINTHYKFIQDRISIRDSRILTPGMISKVRRAWKLVMVVICGSEITNNREFNELDIVRNPLRKEKKELNISFIKSAQPFPLTKKDCQAARALLSYRRSINISPCDPPSWGQLKESRLHQSLFRRSFAWTLMSYSSSECIDYTETE
ncbi:L RNA-dependent RNA polymerase [Tree fern varicosa-like virus]|uniref:Replicase n=1 Tax=Tree fern varicosa-like virus TaxID=2933191 RepID=A0A9C7GWP0_9RHAB|nr:L RNA-dependent RNA polymerase [Tree fern varicosa-like virus]CAI5383995.1 L RNA-dependent RNA polymerase [Tree fern varicosa-like virus]